MSQAAAATARLLADECPQRVVLCGIAGACDEGMERGSVVEVVEDSEYGLPALYAERYEPQRLTSLPAVKAFTVSRSGASMAERVTAFEQMVNPYLGNDTTMNCSQETAARIDREVIALIDKAYDQAKTILKDNRSKLDEIARVLIERETISGQEFMDILNAPVALPVSQEMKEE